MKAAQLPSAVKALARTAEEDLKRWRCVCVREREKERVSQYSVGRSAKRNRKSKST
jgi:hypothetical protein